MKRYLVFITIALLGLTRTLNAASTNWPPVDYVEVRAYLYNLEGDQSAPIWEQGKLNASVWNPKGVVLNKAQIAKVRKTVADHYPTSLAPPASCYRPRHAFIYYDSKHQPIGAIEICFSCWNYRISWTPPGPVDLKKLKKVFLELKIPVLDNDDAYLALKKRKTK